MLIGIRLQMILLIIKQHFKKPWEEKEDLQKKVAELEKELNSKGIVVNSLMTIITDLEESQKEYEEFEAQNAKMREALELIQNIGEYNTCGIAREALKESGDE